MQIHVVRPGETLYAIARTYGVSLYRLEQDNGQPPDRPLVVGQTLVIRHPAVQHRVREGETLDSIARNYGLTVRALYRNNPELRARPNLRPGENLVISYAGQKLGSALVAGYAYPYIDRELLRETMPFLTELMPFTYGITPQGELVELEDEELIRVAREYRVRPMMHLSTLTEEGGFSNELASLVVRDAAVRQNLMGEIEEQLQEEGYRGLDVDFEFVPAADGAGYAAFLEELTRVLGPRGYKTMAALAPKTSADQRGLLYEGHDYAAVGAAVEQILLMTYEWGYTYGPPMAVAPLPNVRRVLDYALTEIPAAKLLLGMPNYGYDWPLPFRQGESRARSISNVEAVQIAARYGAEISYDEYSKSPYFRYADERGQQHEVWFEDARSIEAKLRLIRDYGLRGAGYWNLMRPFPQNWLVLNGLYQVAEG